MLLHCRFDWHFPEASNIEPRIYYILVIPALGQWTQENQMFKIILSCILSVRHGVGGPTVYVLLLLVNK